jgi:hypothetical protein
LQVDIAGADLAIARTEAPESENQNQNPAPSFAGFSLPIDSVSVRQSTIRAEIEWGPVELGLEGDLSGSGTLSGDFDCQF